MGDDKLEKRMKNKFLLFAAVVLLILSMNLVNSREITINSTNSLFENIFSINNGTNVFYLLNISKERTTNDLISKVSQNLETKNLNSTAAINLANQNITFETISVRQKKNIRLETSGLGNTYIETPSSAENNFDFLAGKTFSAYLLLTNDGATQTVMSKGGGLANSGYILRVDNNRRLSWKSNGTTNTAGAVNSFKNGVWQYATWTFNATHARGYINGTLIGSSQYNETGGNAFAFDIGAQSNSKTTFPLNGSIRMISIINQTLSDQQAKALYWNNGVPTKWANLTEVSHAGSVAVKPDGGIIIIDGSRIYTSSDKGATVTLNHSFGADRNGTTGIFIDSFNNVYVNWQNINSLFRYQNFDFTNEQRVLNITCDNSTKARLVMPDTFTQARNNNIFVGTYDASASGVQYSEQCGHIYMSANQGEDWSLVYNDTAEETASFRIARHVHSVQCDPYSTNCYASMGDGVERKKLIRFNQDGTGFTVIQRGYKDGISWQPTTLAFTRNYMFIGEDFTPYDEYSRIARSNDNGTTWEIVFNEDKVFQGFIWGQVMSNGTICMNYRNQDGTTDGVAVCSDDDFNTTFNYYRVPASAANGTNTARLPSNVGPNGEFYVLLSEYKNYTRVEINPKPQVIALYPTHENFGNVSHDVSGNGFHGDINGSAWNYSVGYNYLNKYGDYKLNSTLGTISLANSIFNWSEVEIDYDYFTGDSIYNNLRMYYNFDADNSSTSFDLSGNLNNSRFQGTAAPNATGGMFGTPGMITNGNRANYLRVPVSQVLNFSNKNVTLMMWVKPHQGAIMGGLFSSTIAGGGPRITIGTQILQSQLQLRIESQTGESKVSFVSDTFFNQPEWRHVALVLKNNGTGAEIKVFVNGDLEEITHYNVTGDIYNNTDASIGKVHSFASVNGSIDEFMLFDIELLDSQIKAIYNNQSERFYKTGRIQSNGNLAIDSGNNRVKISFNPIRVISLVNASSVISYFNGLWSETSPQLITDNSFYTYNISDSSTAIRFNLSLAGQSGFYSPLIGNNFSYYEFSQGGGGGARPQKVAR